MHWNVRTFVRLFLLVGGLALIGTGAAGGETLTVGLGAVAVVLGIVGLAAEWNESST
ncbi:hypothetical protein [Natrarchaeobaculum aegyptiacum]|uniref:hypothetical protein n=1 Tax=Natrarchaeobaculum aegyptiacum TaxID=745377 RepID=UPI0013748317|nr:hypothetical protein [Natrarchaeobaculum aegyptiacum]